MKKSLNPKGKIPKEFRDRLWLEIVLLALCAPAAVVFYLFSIKPVSAMLLLVTIFLIVDGSRLYYYGYLDHYVVLSGPCTAVRRHKRFRRTYTEVCFECGGLFFNTWTNKALTVKEGCLITAFVPENYLFQEKDGVRHINTIFLKANGEAEKA